jgi:alpha-beta hydrolase superfamily lysophospholipase
VPVLVLGGGKDTCISTTAVHATARAYGTRARIFEDMPHGLMLDPAWETVARATLEWLEETLDVA